MDTSKKAGIAIGAGMTVVGVVMYVVFGYFVEVRIPVFGLRQIGAVLAVVGIIELAAALWPRKKG